ncbi:MAG: biotin/lipoyl-binding protein [Beijerinckiaceae bacterium]
MTAAPATPPPLPQLREDIRLLPDQRRQSGEARWLIHDTLRDSFFDIGLEAFQLLSLWSRAASAPELASLVQQVHGRAVEEEEIATLVRFLAQSRLTLSAAGGWRELSAASEAAHGSLLHRVLHNYLFFKVPLFQPAKVLEATLPLARALASKGMLVLYALISLTGLYLASRQWGDFADGLSRQMNLSGAMLFAITLFVMKIFHELGHAYVATAIGCRVRSMGVAVMMLAPMLYTDVTNAWQLPERRKRMAIDLAGVAVEMVIAGLALFIWAFLPPGDARDVALVVATAAVAMTLAVNLSPFMRFDGYYVLADLLDVRNLQPRAFALVRWKLREWLFRLKAPCPDTIQGGLRAVVIAYGFATMLYRLVLFVGIAVMVYLMTFKLLGIVLFMVEIAVFVAMPVIRELKVLWSLRATVLRTSRTWISAAVVAGLAMLAVVPWSTQVRIPAVLEPAHYARLYPSVSAEVREVRVAIGQVVAEGDVLLVMASPRLEKELAVAEARLALIEQRMARRIGDSKDQLASLTLEKDRLALMEKKRALLRQMDSLSIKASLAGKVVELDPNLYAGRVLSREDEVGIVVADRGAVVRGYADQQDIWRLQAGDAARFLPDDLRSEPRPVRVAALAASVSATIDIPQLAESHGGRLRAHPPQPKSGLVPLDPIHLVSLTPEGQADTPSRSMRGMVLVDGKAESLAATLWRRALKVLVQEMGA